MRASSQTHEHSGGAARSVASECTDMLDEFDIPRTVHRDTF